MVRVAIKYNKILESLNEVFAANICKGSFNVVPGDILRKNDDLAFHLGSTYWVPGENIVNQLIY